MTGALNLINDLDALIVVENFTLLSQVFSRAKAKKL
jgi:hypothetical protein